MAVTEEPDPESWSHLDLWPDLSALEEWYARHRTAESKSGVTIAISVFLEQPEPPGVYFPTIDSSLPSTAKLVGYDVADADLLSALSARSYGDQVSILRPKWQDKLSDHGLLLTAEDAFEFKKLSDQRLPEDGPFFVYALHVLGDAGQELR